MSEEHNRLVEIILDETTLAPASPNAEHERRIALFDLRESNTFVVVGAERGPYALTIALAEGRLAFDVADQNGDRASVVPTNLAYSIVMNGVTGTFSYDGNCAKAAAADGPGGGACLSDIPLMGELGLGHPALTVVHEDGGWYVSLVGTFADWTRTVSENAARLKSEGKLDDPAWLQQQLPMGMTSSLPAGL